ncbi:dehydrogenase [Listeria fleischmannii 1991]|uniref:Uncharacterized oxidoreductase SAV2478 n=2 Tax=Listeria fleischmannii TaxID=1069827 RepID=A0A2X3HAN5_9LIST|nr:SDR family oxidoreductase [Listeria fleischmannii]EMG28698.1 dehydrogenase [Listeria fleischmannii subsp. fleischmannii LU2006-1]KMT57718.1 dehydrogenase [Listeria fleischmannii 1991]SQC69577.1 Uncharacterized oxidoreductase SAV2478 [Listeria fleischmannii subsp. fleischmannii]
MKNIQDKVVVITGASSGIGKETARLLVSKGAKVMLFARRKEQLEELVSELGHDNCGYVVGDVRSTFDMENVIRMTLNKYNRVDVLFANAGIMPASNVSELKLDEWNDMIDINIKGVLNGVAAVFPEFTNQKSGHIVVTSSIAGKKIFPGDAVYCGTKFAVKAIVEGIRQESIAEGTNIKTTILYPGAISTGLLNTITSEKNKHDWEEFYKVAILPETIAESVLYALSQDESVGVNEITILPSKQA